MARQDRARPNVRLIEGLTAALSDYRRTRSDSAFASLASGVGQCCSGYAAGAILRRTGSAAEPHHVQYAAYAIARAGFVPRTRSAVANYCIRSVAGQILDERHVRSIPRRAPNSTGDGIQAHIEADHSSTAATRLLALIPDPRARDYVRLTALGGMTANHAASMLGFPTGDAARKYLARRLRTWNLRRP